MNFEESLYFLDNLLTKKRGREFALPEQEILRAAWYNKTYFTIADNLYLSEGYIKDLASRLWQQISQVLQIRINKSNFRQIMETQNFQQNFQSRNQAIPRKKIINRNDIAENQNEYLGTILIVDDLEEDLKFLSDVLRAEGYKTKCISTPSMVLRVLEHIDPDLILLDVKMPKLDGYELCEILKKNQAVADIPIIFLSALDHINDKIKAFQVGGIDYITKPFYPEEVILRVRSQMMLQSQKKQLLEEICQHQQTIEILYQSRALLASVLNHSPDGILGIQAVRNPSDGIIQDFAVLIVNPSFVEIFAQQQDNFKIGNHILSLLEKISPLLSDLLLQVIETGKSINQVLQINLSNNNQQKLRFIIVKLGDGCSIIVKNII
jgi:DNA-binding response OmpR family regulator